jgi:hypothetical protein
MDIKFNQLKGKVMKTHLYRLLFIALCFLGLYSCKEDEIESPSRLFRPIPNTVKVEGNTLTYEWKKIGGSLSYTIEISEDGSFEVEEKFSRTVEENTCMFENLKYNTQYYARVMANNSDPGKNSAWALWNEPTHTEARIVPALLNVINADDITKNSVTIYWTLDAKNPVDGALVTRQADKTQKEIMFTPAQIAAGSALIDGLDINTTYSVQLFNSLAEEDAKFYNTRTFTTLRDIPAGAIMVGPNDDLAKMFTTELASASTEIIFYLSAGANYYMLSSLERDDDGKVVRPTGGSGVAYNITKSVTFIAEPGPRPTLWVRSGKWQLKSSMAKFEINGVNVKEFVSAELGIATANSTCLFNHDARAAADGSIVIDEFNIINSDIIDLHRGLLMFYNANPLTSTITVKKITIDNCIYTSSIPETAYGFVYIRSTGTDIWNDISITNSSFYNKLSGAGLFGNVPAGALIQQRGNIKIENCTFYDYGVTANGALIIKNLTAPGVNVTVNKCLIAVSNPTTVGVFTAMGNNNTLVSSANNYYTTGWTPKTGDITLVDANISSANLFANPANGDFTIKDKNNDVYKKDIGDPRWIIK